MGTGLICEKDSLQDIHLSSMKTVSFCESDARFLQTDMFCYRCFLCFLTNFLKLSQCVIPEWSNDGWID